jgi:hypothetical protein
VDRIGKNAKEYGMDFNVTPWTRHLVTMTENLKNMAAWAIAMYDMEVSKDKGTIKILRPFTSKSTKAAGKKAVSKSTTRGSTKKRSFLLAMFRDVIDRASARIEADPDARSVLPKRLHHSRGKDAQEFVTPPHPSKKRRVGPPTKHKIIAEYTKKSAYCHACYEKIQEKNLAAGRKRFSQKQILQGAGGTRPRHCRSGCAGCHKRICSTCQKKWKCPGR